MVSQRAYGESLRSCFSNYTEDELKGNITNHHIIMKKEKNLFRSAVSCVLIFVLTLCTPLEVLAQTVNNRSNILEDGTQLLLRVNEEFKADSHTESGVINSTVESDVYSADGSRVLIKSGTPAFIEYIIEPNGAWGKAGKICIVSASTRTIDNKRVALRLNKCKNGSSKIGGVIALSVLLFPIGLISGCMKGSMPKIQQGSIFNATTMQDVVVE